MFRTLLSNFFCFEYFYTHSVVAVLRRSHKSNRNLALLLPLTTKMAEVDRFSTSVSITQTYFPPWFSWMLRIIRSPDMLWKREIRLSKRCSVNYSSSLWLWDAFTFHNIQYNHSDSGPLIFASFKHKQLTWQMYSEQITLLAVLQALSNQPASKPPVNNYPLHTGHTKQTQSS